MPSTIPNKEWMTAKHMSIEYIQGVASFILFTKQNAKDVDWCCCPCVNCRNLKKHNLEVIMEHLICDGIDKSYTTWKHHGERFSKSHVNVGAPSTSASNQNEERKTNPPNHVKSKDWETFVDICLTEQERAHREKGKSSREKMKRPHIIDRRETAKTTEELDEIRRNILTDPFLGERDLDNDPIAKVCGRNGRGCVRGMGRGISKTAIQASAPSREIAHLDKRDLDNEPIAKVCGRNGRGCVRGIGRSVSKTAIQASTPSREIAQQDEIDLDNEPIAKVYGRNGRGCVRGMGRGVSKTAIQASTPSREIAQRDKRARESIESKFDILMQQLDEEGRARRGLEEKLNALSGRVLSQGTHMSDSTDQVGCSSHVRRRSSVHPDSHVDQSSTRCLLKNFKKKVVALGRLNREVTTSAKSYSIIVDDIYDIHTELYASEGTLGDVTFGDTITWPKGLLDFI